ncbi:MAG TPA: FAD-binding oxidoreductase, partial [Blastocatellia bacterium]|nr:FAD-binding oxidoreductase [Blastocatellia bacterium]
MTSANVARSIESIIGEENVEAPPRLLIDGHSPSLLARPGSHQEVRECLRVCSEAGLAVVPAGLRTWLECGNPLRGADVVLSLERMGSIIDYSPADLTVVVEAGLALDELYRATEPERQWLPLDPPGAARASLGAIASCASSGSLRLGFGTPRDYVIGLRLAHADGTESKSGGRVVKNVAGYDMNKLYVGSFGTLAVITGLTFKLRPMPDSSSTQLVISRNQRALSEIASRVLRMDLLPASVILSKGIITDGLGAGPEDLRLAIRFLDNEVSVDYQIDRVKEVLAANGQYLRVTGDQELQLWGGINDLDALGPIAIRISLPLSEVLAYFEREASSVPGCAASCDAGTGIIRIVFDADEQPAIDLIKRLRSEASS